MISLRYRMNRYFTSLLSMFTLINCKVYRKLFAKNIYFNLICVKFQKYSAYYLLQIERMFMIVNSILSILRKTINSIYSFLKLFYFVYFDILQVYRNLFAKNINFNLESSEFNYLLQNLKIVLIINSILSIFCKTIN